MEKETKRKNHRMNKLELDIKSLNIEEGTVFSNYRKMCESLGIEPVTSRGNSRKAQELEIRRYFDYEKIEDTQKLYVTEVYPEPMTREDRRLSDESKQKYIKEQENIMIYIANNIANQTLGERDNYSGTAIIWDVTSSEYWRTMGMINNSYGSMSLKEINNMYLRSQCDSPETYDIIKNIDDDRYKISNKSLEDFYMRTSAKFSSIMKTALKNLSERMVIKYSKEYKIIKYDNKNKIYECCDATQSEVAKIMEVKKQVVNQMGFSLERDIYIAGLRESYYHKVNDKLREKYNWDSVYEYYHIMFVVANLKLEISDIEKENCMTALNKKVVDYFNESIEKSMSNKKERAMDKYNDYVKNHKDSSTRMTFLEFVKENNIYIYNDDYVNQQKFLTDKMIKR